MKAHDTILSEVEIMNFESYLAWYLSSQDRENHTRALPSLEALKRDYIEYLLKITSNDIEAVADILRLPPESLTRRLKKYNYWL